MEEKDKSSGLILCLSWAYAFQESQTAASLALVSPTVVDQSVIPMDLLPYQPISALAPPLLCAGTLQGGGYSFMMSLTGLGVQ